MKKNYLNALKLMSLALVLVGCSANGSPNNYENNKKQDIVEEVEEHTHTFSSAWSSDDNYHWHDADCGHDAINGKQAHSYGSWSIVREPTEHRDGLKRKQCLTCGYIHEESIDVLDHTHTYSEQWSYDSEYHWHDCTCGYNDIAGISTHNFSDWETVKPARDEIYGLEKRTCLICGYAQKRSIQPLPHTHSYSTEWSNDENYHWHASTCFDDTVDSYGEHNYVDTVAFPPTCENSGVLKHTCQECGYYYTESISPTGHNYQFAYFSWLSDNSAADAVYVCANNSAHTQRYTVLSSYEVTKDPTCEGNGTGKYTVYYDGHSDYRYVAIPATGHNYGAPTYIWAEDNSSCTARMICLTDPSHIVEETKPSVHTISLEPTCVDQGEDLYTVSFDNESFDTQSKTVVTEPLGHAFSEPTWDWADDYSSAYATFRCSRCDYETQVMGNITYEDYAPTCEEIGYREYYASVNYLENNYFDVAQQKTADALASLGLEFTLLSNGTYEVSGIGTCTDTNLVIPETHGGGVPVTSIGSSAFNDVKTINNVTMPNCIETIKDRAFNGCSNLQSIGVPNTVTAIGESAFMGCSALTTFAIPNTITTIETGVFKNCSSLESVSIPNSVLTIGANAFNYCNSLTSIELPTALDSIGDSAFYRCNKLSTIGIPNSVTSIGQNAFEGCTGLTEVVVPNGVKTIGKGAFNACSSMSSITIPFVGNGSSISYFSYIFGASNSGESNSYVPSSLKEVVVSSGCKGIGNSAFNKCSKIVSINLPNTIQTIGYNAFSDCSSLVDIALPNLITAINDCLFLNCASLENILIPDGVSSIGRMAFYGCSSLKSIVLPENLNSVGESVFRGCSSLETMVISYTGSGSVSDTYHYLGYLFGAVNIADSFKYVPSSLKTITVGNGCTSIAEEYFYKCTAVETINISDSVTDIGEMAFYNCYSLKTIRMSNSILSIGRQAFEGCSSLETNTYDNALYLGNEQNPYLVLYKAKSTDISTINIHEDCRVIYRNAFEGCRSLTSVFIPNSVVSIGSGAFYDCYSITAFYMEISSSEDFLSIVGKDYLSHPIHILDTKGREITSITIPNSMDTIPDYAFYNCSSLTSITIPNSVVSIGACAFYNCSSLTSLSIPDSVLKIGYNAFYGLNESLFTTYSKGKYLGNDSNPYMVLIGTTDSAITSFSIKSNCKHINCGAFYYCESLTSITIPSSVLTIGQGAFFSCTALKSVSIGSNVISIGVASFENCTALTSITIPNKVTQIGMSAFENCTSLKSATIGSGVESIGDSAFYNCSSLVTLSYKGTIEQWIAIEKGYNWNYNIAATIVKCSNGNYDLTE